MRTAYGAGLDLSLGVEGLLRLEGKVAGALGTTVRLEAASGGEMRDAYSRYVDPPPTRNPKPEIRNPKPYTLHPTPYTLHPSPYTLHPTLNTL